MPRALYAYLHYWFYPNPGFASYDKPTILALMGLCAALIILSFAIRLWRGRLHNAITRKLSKSWSITFFWFGIAGLIMAVARVEQIQFVAMRFLWILWVILLLVYIYFQQRQFRAKHYEVIKTEKVMDPRDRYLPGKKKR